MTEQSETEAAQAARLSSQAGLAALRAGQFITGPSPAPGEPGSRFNPNVRERAESVPTPPTGPESPSAVDLITSVADAMEQGVTSVPAERVQEVAPISQRYDYKFETEQDREASAQSDLEH